MQYLSQRMTNEKHNGTLDDHKSPIKPANKINLPHQGNVTQVIWTALNKQCPEGCYKCMALLGKCNQSQMMDNLLLQFSAERQKQMSCKRFAWSGEISIMCYYIDSLLV